jgi:uncharacterized protein YabN with tetrapyrrole methylase and pyrophosphatase domain
MIGYGINGFSQLTLEAVNALRHSRKVLYLGEPDNWFTELDLKNTESLTSLYKNGAQDLDNYRRILLKIIQDAKTYGEVAVLYPGHPRVGVTILQWLTKLKKEGTIRLEVLPGISSFDTMMNDLDRDPLEKGSIIIDANRLILFNHTIDPTLDLYIYNVCSVGTNKTNFSDASRDNHLEFLQTHLLKFYPPQWEVILIRSSENQQAVPEKIVGIVGDLAGLLKSVNFSTSLFIPGLTPRQVNRSFLQLIESTVAVS